MSEIICNVSQIVFNLEVEGPPPASDLLGLMAGGFVLIVVPVAFALLRGM